MAWTIEYTATARKQLRKLDRQTARRIDRYLAEHIAARQDPRDAGKAPRGPLGGYWRYRVGDFRVVAEIQDQVLRVLVLRVAHRSKIYDR